jgi:ABC-2 type transport system ATP-binding protein
MLLTTHYLDEAEALADRVGVITRGRLVEVAVPALLGGRETAPALVSWTEDGARRTAETAAPTAFVQELAARFPGEVPDLAVARPTLEDVYLQMIGESHA